MTQLKGQYSIFGLLYTKRRPAQYSFPRYLGQKVICRGEEHTITGIDKYYTFFEDNTGGTPHDTVPADKKEYIESLIVELEYEHYKLDHCEPGDSFRKTYIKNIELLEKALKEVNP